MTKLIHNSFLRFDKHRKEAARESGQSKTSSSRDLLPYLNTALVHISYEHDYCLTLY